MSSLLGHIERLANTSKDINNTFQRTNLDHPVGGPFTRAVLESNLGDLIRDIDPSELGLFSLVEPAKSHEETDNNALDIERAEFLGATPLRKQPHRRIDAQKPKELEPEVYAEAALKYLDRYSAFRPAPRARAEVEALLEDLAARRASIQRLNDVLAESGAPEEAPTAKDVAEEEQTRITELQSQIEEVQRRKEAVLKLVEAKKKKPRAHSRPAPPPEPETESEPSQSSADLQEAKFWNDSGPMDMEFSNELLVDDSVNIGEMSMLSFESPLISRTSGRRDEEEEDHTKRILSPPLFSPAAPERSPSPPPRTPTPTPPPREPTPPPPDPAGIRVNSEVERIVTILWSLGSELIFPGRKTSGDEKPLDATETIVLLESLSSKAPLPLSYGAVTQRQIITAHLLLALLSNGPTFALPLNRVKEVLAEREGTTSVLYGCVAKKILKIERGGGEQTVKFDL